jgi:hypothetical protein
MFRLSASVLFQQDTTISQLCGRVRPKYFRTMCNMNFYVDWQVMYTVLQPLQTL